MPTGKIDVYKLNQRKLSLTDNLDEFNCSIDDDLGCNDFIHNEKEAKLFQKEKEGITYLFFLGKKIVAFVTLAMSSIEAKRVDNRYKKPIRLRSYPSLLIGRLAVDNNYRKSGVGKYLCEWCTGLAMSFSSTIGCRYVILETNKKKTDFYTRCKFEEGIEQEDDDGRKIWMYRRIATN